jgi:hypothetical protein
MTIQLKPYLDIRPMGSSLGSCDVSVGLLSWGLCAMSVERSSM